MKESIGQAFVTNLILVFLGILLLLLFYSVNYSRAYKAKNRVIYVIEKYGNYKDAKDEVDSNLEKASYVTLDSNNFSYCDKYSRTGMKNIYPSEYTSNQKTQFFKYCIFETDAGTVANGGKYYQVITFMKFEIPFIGGVLEFPVKGETKNIYDIIE